MKLISKFTLTLLILSIVSCSNIPKECEESWEKMEKISKKMGLTDEQIKEQKQKFEANIKASTKEDAIKSCKMQSSLLGLVN